MTKRGMEKKVGKLIDLYDVSPRYAFCYFNSYLHKHGCDKCSLRESCDQIFESEKERKIKERRG
jgi:hypothetical protein